jgi:hypothetical protein
MMTAVTARKPTKKICDVAEHIMLNSMVLTVLYSPVTPFRALLGGTLRLEPNAGTMAIMVSFAILIVTHAQ